MIQVRHKKKIADEGLSFYHPSMLCCPDQMQAVMKFSQHLVSSSKTVRPIVPQGARCVGHVKMLWSAICSLAHHLQLVEEARPYLCMDELKCPAPVRRQLMVKLPRLCADLRNVDIEC